MYRSLDPSHIVKTIERLQQRIDTRFPGAGLGRVCGELLATAHKSSAQAAKLAQRNWPLRISVGAILALGLAAQIAAAAEQQLAGLEQIAQVLGHIREAAGQTVGGAQETERAAQEMSRLAEQLRQVVEQHRG